MTRTTWARIPKDINTRLKDLSLELGYIEGKRVSVPEIFRRTYSKSEIIERLKIGASENRRFKVGK